MNRFCHSYRRACRGYVTTEVLAAAALAVSAVALAAQLMLVVRAASNEHRQQQAALAAAANQLERLTRRPFAELLPGPVAGVELAPEIAEQLPAAALAATVADEPGSPPARRIVVEVTWQAHGHRSPPVRLTGWVYSQRGPP